MRWRYPAGLAAQAFASATSFVLAVLAAHAAGPAGLGTIYVGFAAYTAMFGLLRAFVTTPLIAVTAARASEESRVATSAALTIVVAFTAVAALGFLVVGLAIGGSVGTGLLYFGPWLVPALIQVFWRSVFFRDGWTRRAIVNDFTWFAVMIMGAPVAFYTNSAAAVVAVWGVGATAAASLAWIASGISPAPPRAAYRWWTNEASRFSVWLVLGETGTILSSYLTVSIIAAVLGAQQLGGLRAGESVFAPITLVLPAIALPGLPAMVRRRERSKRDARRFALRLSTAATVVTAAYFLIVLPLRGEVLGFLFGADFSEFGFLVWPLGVWQLIASITLGYALLLTAERRGKALLAVGVFTALSGVILISILAAAFGASGAAWGYAASAFVTMVITIFFALQPGRS